MKRLILTLIIALTGAAILQAQSPTPAASASPSPKHTRKKTETNPSSSPTATADKSPVAGMEKTTAASLTPAPSPKHSRRKTETKPSSSPTATAEKSPVIGMEKTTATSAGGNDRVWVNTETHVYHVQGSRFYGNTRHGAYMTEAQAKAEGDRPAQRGE
jgi:hypothetical protein